MKAGADLALQDEGGNDALVAARGGGYLPIVALLTASRVAAEGNRECSLLPPAAGDRPPDIDVSPAMITGTSFSKEANTVPVAKKSRQDNSPDFYTVSAGKLRASSRFRTVSNSRVR